MHPDLKEILAEFARHDVQYLVIGGYAVGFHAEPRFTKDLDLWIGEDPLNIDRASAALIAFGATDMVLDHFRAAKPNEIVWMGKPPLRIDFLRSAPGGTFASMYARRVQATWDGIAVSVICKDDLIILKRAAGRTQDLVDLEALTRHPS